MRLLSICIPTYNRSEYLEENLLEIIKQTEQKYFDKLEICISDNDSDDNTESMVYQLKKKYPSILIKYNRNRSNYGPDKNYVLAMHMAEAEYSWLFGSDDILSDNSLQKIFNILECDKSFDIMIFNRIKCDLKMLPYENQNFLRGDIKTEIFDFSDKIVERYYYNCCRSLGGIGSYISSIIYKNNVIKKYNFDESFIGTNYSYLFYHFNTLRNGGRLKYFNEYFVKCRIGNDSFGTGPNRVLLDFNGYKFIRDWFFKDDPAQYDLLSVLKWEHPFQKILQTYCKMQMTEWNELKPFLFECGWTYSEIYGIEKIGNTPNLYQSKFKEHLKNIIAAIRNIKTKIKIHN